MTAAHKRGRGGSVGLCVLAALLALLPAPLRAGEAADETLTGAYHLASPIHQTLTGDWAGLRNRLDERGIEYIGETFADVSGGIHQGTIYEGRLEVGLDLNLQKLVDWHDATFHVSAFQIHGHEASANLVGNLLTVSGIEALPFIGMFMPCIFVPAALATAGNAKRAAIAQAAACILDDLFLAIRSLLSDSIVRVSTEWTLGSVLAAPQFAAARCICMPPIGAGRRGGSASSMETALKGAGNATNPLMVPRMARGRHCETRGASCIGGKDMCIRQLARLHGCPARAHIAIAIEQQFALAAVICTPEQRQGLPDRVRARNDERRLLPLVLPALGGWVKIDREDMQTCGGEASALRGQFLKPGGRHRPREQHQQHRPPLQDTPERVLHRAPLEREVGHRISRRRRNARADLLHLIAGGAGEDEVDHVPTLTRF